MNEDIKSVILFLREIKDENILSLHDKILEKLSLKIYYKFFIFNSDKSLKFFCGVRIPSNYKIKDLSNIIEQKAKLDIILNIEDFN